MPALTTQRIVMSEPPELPILNQIAGATFAISMDKLNIKATSPCTLSFSNAAPNLVTRFLNDKLDRAHVENYIKSVNGGTLVGMSVYVQQSTDQSGSGNHAIQNTQANQPRVMNNGVWDVCMNNKVCMRFDGVNDSLVAVRPFATTSNWNITAIAKKTGARTEIITSDNVLNIGSISVAGWGMQMSVSGGGVVINSVGYNLIGTIPPDNIYFRHTIEREGTVFRGWQNSVAISPSTIPSGALRIGTGEFLYTQTNIQEVIIFNNILATASRKKLDRSHLIRYKI